MEFLVGRAPLLGQKYLFKIFLCSGVLWCSTTYSRYIVPIREALGSLGGRPLQWVKKLMQPKKKYLD